VIFISPTTGLEHEHAQVSTVYRNGGTVYLDRYRNEIVCPSSGRPLVPAPAPARDWSDGVAPAFGSIASMSPKQRQQAMRQRSSAHFNSHIKEKKEHMQREFVKTSREKFGLA